MVPIFLDHRSVPTASPEHVGTPWFDKLTAIQTLFPAKLESGNQET